MKGKWIKGIIEVIGIIAILISLIFLDNLANWYRRTDPVKSQKIIQETNTNAYGLTGNQELAHTVLYENEDAVCFPDRIVRHFNYEDKHVDNMVNIVQGIYKQCPKINKIYIMPVPMRILYEKGYTEDKGKYDVYLNALLKGLDRENINYAELVDVSRVLEEHNNEYLFFRTEDTWTSTGAYYGASCLCELLGNILHPLDTYDKYEYNHFKGSLYAAQRKLLQEDELLYSQIGHMPEDSLVYYLHPTNKNRAIVCDDERGKDEIIKRPMISQSAYGLAYVIGNSYKYAVLKNNNKEAKEKGILLICDNSGKLIAPYLTDYYETVYVVNVKEEEDLSLKLNNIIEQYQVSDIIWVQKADKMGNRAYNRSINDFLMEE